MAPNPPKFQKKKPPADSVSDGTTTLHLALDPLESIYVYADELKDPTTSAQKSQQGGSVTFVAVSGKKFTARLERVWFPAGSWSLEISKNPVIKSFKPLFPKEVAPEVLENLKRHRLENKDPLIRWVHAKSDAKAIQRLIDSSEGRFVRLVVSYSKVEGGNAKNLPDKLPLTSGDIKLLADETVARIYLEFVQHFGGVNPDFNLAVGGLTRAELDLVEQNKPELIAITDLFLQGFAEFQAAKGAAKPPVTLVEFRAMEQQIFYQRKVRNDLARRNMLMIGMGSLLFTAENGARDLKDDIGVLRRTVKGGGKRLLLYDRDGNAVRGIIGGFLDTEFRSTDLSKFKRDTGIPQFDITVKDEALYKILRQFEQDLAHPVREIEALAVSYYKYSIFITGEIHRRYNGEIGQRLLAMGFPVIGFFVAHAFVSFLVTTQPAVGVPLMLLLQAGGMVLGFDSLLMDMSLMTKAGRHFTQMEQLHREDGKKPELTKLSEAHLKAGAAALLDAMSDFIAGGVLVVGGFGIAKLGPALIQGIKNKASARCKVTVEAGEIKKIEPTKPAKEVETVAPKVEGERGGLGVENAPEPTGSKPIEQPDAYSGDALPGKQPDQPVHVLTRPRALDMSPEQFKADKAAQQELFQAAKDAVQRQNQFIQKILAELKIKDADAESILKRDDPAEFVQKVLDKVGDRKKSKYKTIGQMTDIIRGRINVEDPKDVQRVVRALIEQTEHRKIRHEEPKVRVNVEEGYPRHHVDVADQPTNMTHEWQIGTKQTTELFQKPGIDPAGVKIDPKNTNLHDIEYDIFKQLNEPEDSLPSATQEEFVQLATELGIPEFREKLAKFAARTLNEKVPAPELEKIIGEFHGEASKIMRALVEKKGVPFVQEFLH